MAQLYTDDANGNSEEVKASHEIILVPKSTEPHPTYWSLSIWKSKETQFDSVLIFKSTWNLIVYPI